MIDLRKIATCVFVVVIASACMVSLVGCGSDNQKTADKASANDASAYSFNPVSLTLFDDDVAFEVVSTNGWQDNGKTYLQFNVNVENQGDDVDGWSVSIPFNGKVSVSDFWDSECTVDGKSLIVTNDSNNGSLGSGECVKGVGFIVSGESNLGIFL